MGRKQKEKKESKSNWSAWLIGVVVFMALLIGGLVILVQTNKARFVKLSVITSCEKLQRELYRMQANFTRAEATRIRKVLTAIKQMANTEDTLDVRIGGHLLFVLKVAEEIITDGKLRPGELDKMEMLVHEAEREHRKKNKP